MEDLSKMSGADLIGELAIKLYDANCSDNWEGRFDWTPINNLRAELKRRLEVYDQVNKAAPSLKKMINFIGGNYTKITLTDTDNGEDIPFIIEEIE